MFQRKNGTQIGNKNHGLMKKYKKEGYCFAEICVGTYIFRVLHKKGLNLYTTHKHFPS